MGGGLSYTTGVKPCVVATPSTDWAAAEVAGVAALVWSARPAMNADALRDWLERTADGGGQRQGNTMGYGVVQPLSAVTLSPSALSGGPNTPVSRPAVAPDPPADVLAKTRHNAVWWGLFGGGALVVALLLRPLFARRRDRS